MVICRYFQQGCCRFGNNCRFEHIYGQKYTYNAPKSNSNTENVQITVEQLINQVVSEVNVALKSGQWLLSCFGPFKTKPNIPGIFDLSPEELRLMTYEVKTNGNLSEFLNQVRHYQDIVVNNLMLLSKPTCSATLEQLYKGEITGSPFHLPADENHIYNTFIASKSNNFNFSSTNNPNVTSGNVFNGPQNFQNPSSNMFNEPVNLARTFQSSNSTNVFQQSDSMNVFQPSNSTNAFQQSNSTIAFQPNNSANTFHQSSPTSAFQQNSPTSAFQQNSPTNAFQPTSSTNAFQQTSTSNVFQQTSSTNAFQQTSSTHAFQTGNSTDAFQSNNVFSSNNTASLFSAPIPNSNNLFTQNNNDFSPSALFAAANAGLQNTQQPQSNIFNNTNDVQKSIYKNPFEKHQSHFPANASENVFSSPFNIKSQHPLNGNDDTIYSKIEILIEDELAAFKGNTFHEGLIPEVAPPFSLCS